MAYTHQIRILETQLIRLAKELSDTNTEVKTKYFNIQSEISRLKRLEWEEKYERVDMGDER